MNNKPYPQTLVTELAKFGKRPTGDADWDACILQVCRNNRKSAPTWLSLHDAALRFREEAEKVRKQAYNLADPDVYSAHSAFVMHIANNIVLAPQRRKFIVDYNNRDVLRFLLYYFNNCPLAEEVFPGRGYKVHKSILIQGGVGVGKTEESLQKRGIAYRAVKLPMAYSGRFVAENEGVNGVCKLLLGSDDTVLGAHVLGNPASEIITLAGMAIELKLTADEWKKIVFPHPTVGEIFKEAL